MSGRERVVFGMSAALGVLCLSARAAAYEVSPVVEPPAWLQLTILSCLAVLCLSLGMGLAVKIGRQLRRLSATHAQTLRAELAILNGGALLLCLIAPYLILEAPGLGLWLTLFTALGLLWARLRRGRSKPTR